MVFPDRSKQKNNGSPLPLLRRTSVAAALGTALLLGACGGGDQKETFQAQRVVVFGDENSLLNPDGTKYTINYKDPTTLVLNCTANPLWVQLVAANYGLVFPECNPNNLPAPASRMRAAFHAKVADVQSQINTFALTNLQATDLVIMMAGVHDVLGQLQASPRASESAMLAAVSQAGVQMGQNVLNITGRGSKVLIATIPRLAETPYVQQFPADADLMNRLSDAFNSALRLKIAEDTNGGGRSGALISVDDEISLFRQNLNNQFGFTDTVNAGCGTTPANPVPTAVNDANLPTQCDTTTVNAATTSWLWAGPTQFSALGHTRLGDRAVLRLRANPL